LQDEENSTHHEQKPTREVESFFRLVYDWYLLSVILYLRTSRLYHTIIRCGWLRVFR
jgi:hypothetical protein